MTARAGGGDLQPGERPANRRSDRPSPRPRAGTQGAASARL